MQVGDVLNGTYRIVRPLGVGGQARVWQARHLRMPRLLAIKECPLAGLDPRERAERRALFERERDILAALSFPGHPAIPKISDFWEESERLFMVLDLVDGETLDDVVARRRWVSEAEVVDWGKQIAGILIYLHSWNPPIIYRDLSPDNVMLARSGQLHLIDFGIARYYKGGKAGNTVSLGKVGYASPEHLAGGKQTDARSDIYTVGALLYYLLTGREPVSVVDRIKHRAGLLGGHALILPRLLNPQISQGMEACLLRSLELEPGQRYQSAQELLRSLETGYVPPAPRSPADADPFIQRVRSRPVNPSSTLGLADQPTGVTPALTPRPWPREQSYGSDAATPHSPSGPGINRSTPVPPNEHPAQQPGIQTGRLPRISAPQPFYPTNQSGSVSPWLTDGLGTPQRARYTPGLLGTRTGPQQEAPQPRAPGDPLPPFPAGRPPLPAAPPESRRTLSRRRLLFGLAGVAVAAAGAGTAAFFLSRPRAPYAKLFTLTGDNVPVNCVAWSPNAPRLASGANNDLVRIWDTLHGTPYLILEGHSDFVLGVAWSPSGQALASASADKTILLWNPLQGGKPQMTLTGHTDTVYSVAWSPDNRLLASASADQTVRIWDATTGKPIRRLTGHTDAVYAVAWSPDGNFIASASHDGTAKIWNPAQDGEPLHSLDNGKGSVRGVAWSPDSTRVAAANHDKVVTVWNADISFPPAYTLGGAADALTSVSWSPTGALLAAGSSDHSIAIWSAQPGAPPPSILTSHNDMVTAVAWSPDNLMLASASTDKSVIVWQKQS